MDTQMLAALAGEFESVKAIVADLGPKVVDCIVEALDSESASKLHDALARSTYKLHQSYCAAGFDKDAATALVIRSLDHLDGAIKKGG